MSRTVLRLGSLAGLLSAAALQSPPAAARPAENFSYTTTIETEVCGQPGTLAARVFLHTRSTGSEGGPSTSTFIDRTSGTFTVGDDVYRYTQSSTFSDHERLDDGETSGNHLIGRIRLSGSGPLAGTQLDQHINTVVDANGVTRVDTYVSAFCQ